MLIFHGNFAGVQNVTDTDLCVLAISVGVDCCHGALKEMAVLLLTQDLLGRRFGPTGARFWGLYRPACSKTRLLFGGAHFVGGNHRRGGGRMVFPRTLLDHDLRVSLNRCDEPRMANRHAQ